MYLFLFFLCKTKINAEGVPVNKVPVFYPIPIRKYSNILAR